MFREFREFAFKGNVLDLAVGVSIGGAFSGLVRSLVNGMIVPFFTRTLGGKIDFSDWFVALNGQTYATLEAARAADAPVIAYGAFATDVFNSMLLAAVLYFFLVKPANHFRLTGSEEKTDLAVVNVQQNARIIELLEKLTNTPTSSQNVPTEKLSPSL